MSEFLDQAKAEVAAQRYAIAEVYAALAQAEALERIARTLEGARLRDAFLVQVRGG